MDRSFPMKGAWMLAGMPMMLLASAQAGAAVPSAGTGPAPQAPATGAATSTQPCPPPRIEPGEVVVCAPKFEGYRINPDVLEAKRRARKGSRPKRPERYVDNRCASVGPAGCMGATGIDILGAALVAGKMIDKAIKGENVGKMFVTDPQPSEYELYLEAKREREEREAEQAVKARARAKAAAASTESPSP